MTNRSGLARHAASRSRRTRAGISLIEIVVACTLLAMALTALTGLGARMAARTRGVAYEEQKQATIYQEVNRVESMVYADLNAQLVTDSVKSGANWYVYSFAISDSLSATGPAQYKKIVLTVTPRIIGQSAQVVIIRRARPPTANALNTGP